MPVGRGKCEACALDVGREHDAVIADADFLDVLDAVCCAVVDVRLLDTRRRVGDVDGVFANAFAQCLAPCARTTAIDDRGRELGVLTKSFGDDGGIWKDG